MTSEESKGPVSFIYLKADTRMLSLTNMYSFHSSFIGRLDYLSFINTYLLLIEVVEIFKGNFANCSKYHLLTYHNYLITQ